MFARHDWVDSVLSFGSAVALMILVTPAVIAWARRNDFVAHPKQDRWHTQPTALMGGIAIYLSALLAALLFAWEPDTWPIWLGATVMFVVGLVDDLRGVRPATKLVAQVVSAGLLVLGGFVFGSTLPVWIHVPLTFLWIIGITNAVNLLDNMDGLAAGIVCIAAFVLAGFGAMDGGAGMGPALVTAGAAGGFLLFNFKPARIFMGDSGSLFLGYMIAALAIVVQGGGEASRGFAVYLVSGLILAVPILDTTLVTLVRPAAGRSVKQGGRDHTSHRLVFLGLSERRAVLTLYAISIVFGGLALLFHQSDVQLFYAVVIVMGVALAVFGIYLGGLDVYVNEPAPEYRLAGWVGRAQAIVYATVGYSWKTLFGVVADLLLVVASFILAYHLRFEKGISPEQLVFISGVLPLIVLTKIPVFYAMGLYKGIWRYAGAPELVRIVKATILSSVALFLVLATIFGFSRIPRGVILIDWMTVTIVVVAIRFGFRAVPRYLATKRVTGKRVLLYGAGDAGMMVLTEIRQNPGLGFLPVGFVDDEISKVGLMVQGLPVVGTRGDLVAACSRLQVEEILITNRKMTEERLQETVSTCRSLGIQCRTVTLQFNDAIVDVSVSDPMRFGMAHAS